MHPSLVLFFFFFQTSGASFNWCIMASSLVSFIRDRHLFQNGKLSSRDFKKRKLVVRYQIVSCLARHACKSTKIQLSLSFCTQNPSYSLKLKCVFLIPGIYSEMAVSRQRTVPHGKSTRSILEKMRKHAPAERNFWDLLKKTTFEITQETIRNTCKGYYSLCNQEYRKYRHCHGAPSSVLDLTHLTLLSHEVSGPATL
jgi:hypothetical protein